MVDKRLRLLDWAIGRGMAGMDLELFQQEW
jgi:hypothetical protein